MRALALSAGLVLTACAGVQDELARDAAKRAVRPVLAQNFPGVPLEPAVDCVIDNANARELQTLAVAASQARPSPDAAALVIEIATRPETLRCLTTSGIAPFLR
ncbi:MAG: hypothetical protein ACK4HW_02955 [Roseinatronobacter sp.]